MNLSTVVPGQIWSSQYAVKFGPLAINSRATIVRLANGSLWIHSPMPVSEDLFQKLTTIGEVAYVVAPNLMHHLFYQAFLEAFPNACGFYAPGLEGKVGALSGEALNKRDRLPWLPELLDNFIAGLPVLNETVWLHQPSKTLIATDLLFCFSRSNPITMRIIARALGVLDQLGMSRTMKRCVKDKQAFKKSIERIKSWDVQRIIVAHDQIIENNAKKRLLDSFSWLDD